MDNKQGNAGYAVLGFFFPLIGLILYLVWKDSKPGDAHSAGKGALIGVIVSAIIGVCCFAFVSCFAASAAKEINDSINQLFIKL